MSSLATTVVKGDILSTIAVKGNTHTVTLTGVVHGDEPEVGDEDILTFVVSRSGYVLTL